VLTAGAVFVVCMGALLKVRIGRWIAQVVA